MNKSTSVADMICINHCGKTESTELIHDARMCICFYCRLPVPIFVGLCTYTYINALHVTM